MQEKETIKQKLLLPLLLPVSNFFYGPSAGQLGIILAVLKGAAATDNPFFLADAIGGDGGYRTMLTRSFTHDGIPIEGGAYAKVALQRIKILAKLLKRLNINADNQRIQQILYNSDMLFNFKAPKNSKTLKRSGWTFLVNKKEPRLKFSVNWGTSRDRKECDQASYLLSDQQGVLIGETGRLPYGSPLCFIMYKTFAHNIPVINQQDITKEKFKQTYFFNGKSYSCCQISDTKDTPAYPHVRMNRSFVLFSNILLVVDKVNAEKKVNIDIPFYIQDAQKQTTSWQTCENISKLTGPRHYQTPYNLIKTEKQLSSFNLSWLCDKKKKRKLFLHYTGSPVYVIDGKTKSGWRLKSNDFMMLRTNINQFLGALAYSVSHHKLSQPKITSFKKVPVLDQHKQMVSTQKAVSYQITLSDSRKINVLIAFEAGSFHTSTIKLPANKRIVLVESK